MAWYYNNSGDQILGGDLSFNKLKSNNNRTHNVATKQANAWSLFGIHGNIKEWVQDIYNPSYQNLSSDSSASVSGGYLSHVVHGGSWFSDSKTCRSAYRGYILPATRSKLFSEQLEK